MSRKFPIGVATKNRVPIKLGGLRYHSAELRFKQRSREITRQAKSVSWETTKGNSGPVYAGLARLFRLLQNAGPVDTADSLGSLAPSGGVVAGVGNAPARPG